VKHGQITTWSYSRWKDFDTCPFKAKCKYVDKLPEPGSKAMERGTMIHKMAEDYVNKAIEELPDELALHADGLAKLRGGRAKCELEWAFTSTWEPTTWFAGDVWCRVKADVIGEMDGQLYIIDHKTGKKYPDHAKQLGLYALAAFVMMPSVQNIKAEAWYLDLGEKLSTGFDRDELPDIKEVWEDRARTMLSATSFRAIPNRLCRWCHYRKENGGPCEY
jgi:RecB family exonuclease